MYDQNNIFAKIIRKEIPCDKVFEDERWPQGDWGPCRFWRRNRARKTRAACEIPFLVSTVWSLYSATPHTYKHWIGEIDYRVEISNSNWTCSLEPSLVTERCESGFSGPNLEEGAISII